ncbi:nucleoside monophosphate kinase, partial [candidate division WOR-3 bacterium]|nr:nucleoside monophosphate kinase [candidate division WOR-3 bacterium]
MNIIFLGAPGSGKGTQATKIANDFMLQHISSGDILRDAIMEKTPLGKKVKSHLESGTLVPDRIMSDIISQRLMSLRLIHQKIDRRNGSPRPFH